ncbi:hypothetical protein WJ970_24795 [Achromobacter xylosoxidans]
MTVYPSILRVTAASGNIYYGRSAKSGSPGSTPAACCSRPRPAAS